jgi:predicted molibdopterin-dependent oxidoreductase YjgC
MRTHGAMTKVTEALEAHKLHLLAEVDVIDAHARSLMDLAQVERESKWEAIQASVAMVDRMLADLRGA